jgi:hypothetical protein
MKRKDVEKLLHYLSDHIQLEGDIINPEPINVKLLKFGSFKSNTKLFSNSILVKTRTDVHVLPLRCPYEYRQHSSINTWIALHTKLTTDFNKTILEFEILQKFREQRQNLLNQQLMYVNTNQTTENFN